MHPLIQIPIELYLFQAKTHLPSDFQGKKAGFV